MFNTINPASRATLDPEKVIAWMEAHGWKRVQTYDDISSNANHLFTKPNSSDFRSDPNYDSRLICVDFPSCSRVDFNVLSRGSGMKPLDIFAEMGGVLKEGPSDNEIWTKQRAEFLAKQTPPSPENIRTPLLPYERDIAVKTYVVPKKAEE